MSRLFKVIGFAGPSCSGKTTLAKKIAIDHNGRYLCLDDYWIEGQEPIIVKGRKTKERPSQYDAARLLDDIKLFRKTQLVVVDGFLIFTYPEIFEQCDARFFMQLRDNDIVGRRRERHNLGYGKSSSTELSFIKHGLDEWHEFGASQLFKPDVIPLNGYLAPQRLLAETNKHLEILKNRRHLEQQATDAELELSAVRSVLQGYQYVLKNILHTACDFTDRFNRRDIEDIAMTTEKGNTPILVFQRTGLSIEKVMEEVICGKYDDGR